MIEALIGWAVASTAGAIYTTVRLVKAWRKVQDLRGIIEDNNAKFNGYISDRDAQRVEARKALDEAIEKVIQNW